MFEVVFDYGEHDANAPQPDDDPAKSNSTPWPVATIRSRPTARVSRFAPTACASGSYVPPFRGRDGRAVRTASSAPPTSPTPMSRIRRTRATHLLVPALGHADAATSASQRRLPQEIAAAGRVHLQRGRRSRKRCAKSTAGSLENLPVGLDGSAYQWVDLDGEGLSGILTEQADGWFYKRNLSPINVVSANGGRARRSALRARRTRRHQARVRPRWRPRAIHGPGRRRPARPGHVRRPDARLLRTHDGRGKLGAVHVPSLPCPMLDWGDPNLKFVDLTGDGHADVLITEDDVFRWHPSLAKRASARAKRAANPATRKTARARLRRRHAVHLSRRHERRRPHRSGAHPQRRSLLLAQPRLRPLRRQGHDGQRAVVRLPGPVRPEAHPAGRHRRLRHSPTSSICTATACASTSTSPATVGASRRRCTAFPRIDDLASIRLVDLLGNGTACLVWSSPLPGDARRPMRYVDLMGGQKPHLLVKTVQQPRRRNDRRSTRLRPSSICRTSAPANRGSRKLPFPVHCRREESPSRTNGGRPLSPRPTPITTAISTAPNASSAASAASNSWMSSPTANSPQGNTASPYITDDKTLYQPPVKTVTWFHTGALLDRERILSQFAHEYFPAGLRTCNRTPSTSWEVFRRMSCRSRIWLRKTSVPKSGAKPCAPARA